jgi:isoprenylcysteine carboxyl methyltransferase (ICMT) family protein YpbQ
VKYWLIAAVWVAWFVFAGGVGVARSNPGDKVDDRGTRVWADAMTVVCMGAAIAAAHWTRSASIPGSPWLTLAMGTAAAGLGIALRRWAARTLGRFFTQSVTICERHAVITTGPYRLVRHPGYTGMLISMIGLALTLGNWVSLWISVVGFFAGHVPRIKVEEQVLEENLGEAYKSFERSRKRLIPGVW